MLFSFNFLCLFWRFVPRNTKNDTKEELGVLPGCRRAQFASPRRACDKRCPWPPYAKHLVRDKISSVLLRRNEKLFLKSNTTFEASIAKQMASYIKHKTCRNKNSTEVSGEHNIKRSNPSFALS